MSYTLWEFMDKSLDPVTGTLLYIATFIILLLFYRIVRAWALNLNEI